MVALPGPPVFAVNTAIGVLKQKDSAGFAKYAADLSKAESTSRISVAYENAIALNEDELDNAIESAGFSSAQTSNDVNHIQDIIDASFTGTINKAGLEAYLQGTEIAPSVVKLTLSNMESIAKQSNLSARMHATLTADSNAIAAALGSNPDTDLGVGETDRDPLIVYDDAQAVKFVR